MRTERTKRHGRKGKTKMWRRLGSGRPSLRAAQHSVQMLQNIVTRRLSMAATPTRHRSIGT